MDKELEGEIENIRRLVTDLKYESIRETNPVKVLDTWKNRECCSIFAKDKIKLVAILNEDTTIDIDFL